MRSLQALAIVALSIAGGLGLACAVTAPELRAEDRDERAVRVGTFDSRAVAIAYYRSEEFKRAMRELHEQHEDAKSSGDAERAAALESQGREQQELTHKQSFGVWPIGEILKKTEKEIPAIADRAGVDLIVSKWDLVYRRRGVETTDVTESLVARFAPDSETMKIVRDIQTKAPIPIDVLEKHDH